MCGSGELRLLGFEKGLFRFAVNRKVSTMGQAPARRRRSSCVVLYSRSSDRQSVSTHLLSDWTTLGIENDVTEKACES